MSGAEVAAQAGAAYGERSPERITRRNGYRPRRWDTRAGSIELQIPKLRQGIDVERGTFHVIKTLKIEKREFRMAPRRRTARAA